MSKCNIQAYRFCKSKRKFMHKRAHPQLTDVMQECKINPKISCKVYALRFTIAHALAPHDAPGDEPLRPTVPPYALSTGCLSKRIARWRDRMRSCSRSLQGCTPG